MPGGDLSYSLLLPFTTSPGPMKYVTCLPTATRDGPGGRKTTSALPNRPMRPAVGHTHFFPCYAWACIHVRHISIHTDTLPGHQRRPLGFCRFSAAAETAEVYSTWVYEQSAEEGSSANQPTLRGTKLHLPSYPSHTTFLAKTHICAMRPPKCTSRAPTAQSGDSSGLGGTQTAPCRTGLSIPPPRAPSLLVIPSVPADGSGHQ